jgi:SAM-dependent methyltransferase
MAEGTSDTGGMDRRADYGFDAPPALISLGVIAVLCLALTAVLAVILPGWWWLIPLAYGLFFLLSFASYLYTTRRGKFAVWRELLQALPLTGRERVVDLGCGRGAVLNLVARRVPQGRALGVDLWKSVDQSGNDPATAKRNAAAEGVEVALVTADMRALPIASASVDLVVSSLAIHNIRQESGREKAIAEAARILRPGGRLMVADFRNTDKYASQLRGLGLRDVTVRDLGWRFWYSGPWGKTRVVTATR